MREVRCPITVCLFPDCLEREKTEAESSTSDVERFGFAAGFQTRNEQLRVETQIVFRTSKKLHF